MPEIIDIINFYLEDNEGIKEVKKFAKWAWGSEYRKVNVSKNAVLIWNELHGDLLKISPEGNPHEDLPKMIEFWRKKDNESKN